MARSRFQNPSLQTAGEGKNEYFFVRFRVYREDGSSIRKQETIGPVSMGKRAAEKAKQELVTAQTGSLPKMHAIAKGTTTLEEFYKDRFLPLKSHWSAPHRESFMHIIRKHVLPQFGKTPIADIDKVQIQTRLNALAKSYSWITIRHVKTKFSEILEEAVEQDYIPKNPAKKLQIPSEAREPFKPTLTKEQLIALIDGLTDPRDKALFMIGSFCALRSSEAFGLPWSALGYENEQPFLMIEQIAYRGEIFPRTKNKSSKAKVHISQKTLEAVLEWQKECPHAGANDPQALMFPVSNKKHKPMFPSNWFLHRLQPVADELGIEFPVNFRATRRTAATLISDQGSSVASAQGVLRHASPTVTQGTYIQQVPESVRKAVNSFEDSVFAARPKPVRIK